jgi:hypothetical protein
VTLPRASEARAPLELAVLARDHLDSDAPTKALLVAILSEAAETLRAAQTAKPLSVKLPVALAVSAPCVGRTRL